jgi:hypothetical protein
LVALEKDDEDADEAVDLVSLVKEAMGNSPALRRQLEADLGEDCGDGLACSAVFLRAEQAQGLRGDEGTLTFDALRLEIDAARKRSTRRVATRALWRARDAAARVNQARPRLGATAALVLQALDWLLVLWLALLLALLPRCWDCRRTAGPSGELVPRWPQLALRRKHLEALVADRVVSAADALGLCSGPTTGPSSSRGAADDGLAAPAAAGAFRRGSGRLARGPASSGGHFSPLRLGAAALGDAARVADDALSDPRLHAAWLEAQAAAADALARLAAALREDPANCARDAAERLTWCAKQAPAAARALRDRVRRRGARDVASELARGALAAVLRAGRGGRGASHARDLRATAAPRPSPLVARVRSQSPRAGRNSRSQSPRAGASGAAAAVWERDASTSPRAPRAALGDKNKESPAQ